MKHVLVVLADAIPNSIDVSLRDILSVPMHDRGGTAWCPRIASLLPAVERQQWQQRQKKRNRNITEPTKQHEEQRATQQRATQQQGEGDCTSTALTHNGTQKPWLPETCLS